MVTFSECASQGYTLGEVACSSCRAVARVFGDDSPSAAACRSCCTASLDWVSPRKYDVAVLKVRETTFSYPYPQCVNHPGIKSSRSLRSMPRLSGAA